MKMNSMRHLIPETKGRAGIACNSLVYLIARCGTGLSMILALCLVPVSVSAQSLESRVQRLERILDNAALIEIVQTMDALQTEVRRLRGELEQKTFEIESMRERQRKLYLDTDGRLRALEEGGVSGLNSLDSLDDLDDLDDLDNPSLTSRTPPAQSTQPRVVDNRADERQEKLDYQDAYDLLILGRNNEAIQQFEQFLSRYPRGIYSDNAHYWLGEANYVERRFNEAIDRFNVVIFQFPGSRKVPDARLRKGFSLFELQRYAEAREELSAVEREYRGRSIAALARRRLEQMNNSGL
jgi:tol-pal system protein YbgF